MDIGDIEMILRQYDRSEFLRKVHEDIPKARKGIVILATPNSDGRLALTAYQFGFEYLYEVDGFLGLAASRLCDSQEPIDGNGDEEIQ